MGYTLQSWVVRRTIKYKTSPRGSRAVKFFAFCHPELAKDLPQQRGILAGDASPRPA